MAIEAPSLGQIDAARADLREWLGNEVVAETDSQYSTARRVWNAAVDARPALIARCRDADDVVAAVRAARVHGLPL